MFELEIKGTVYPLNFGMGFLREVNKKISIPVDGAPGVKQNVGLRHIIGRLMDCDMEALVEVLSAAGYKQEPRITADLLDKYIDDPDTDVDELFNKVMDFLEKSNATRKTLQEMKKLYEVEMAKANQ
jgi:hypothetical protein